MCHIVQLQHGGVWSFENDHFSLGGFNRWPRSINLCDCENNETSCSNIILFNREGVKIFEQIYTLLKLWRTSSNFYTLMPDSQK